MIITVLGATGTIGSQLTSALLAAGTRVRAVGRSPHGLSRLAALGAEPHAAEARDPVALAQAMRGADAVWTMMPIDPAASDHRADQRLFGEAAIRAIRDSGIERVVALSSLGAELPDGTGFLIGLHQQEQRLATLTDRAVLALRPGWFYDNARTYLPLIETDGIVVDSLDPHVPVPMVATRDVAAVAADALLRGGWTDHAVRELLGPVDVDQTTATVALGSALGRPELSYVRMPDDDMVAALVDEGWTEDVALQHVGLTAAINEGRIRPQQPRTAELTMPTTYAEYARSLAAHSNNSIGNQSRGDAVSDSRRSGQDGG